MSSIKSVVDENMCTGCGLCAQSKEGMQFDPEGYLRPLEGISDEISASCCPGIKVQHHNSSSNYDPYWGPIKYAKTGYAGDSNLRDKASSGGVISSILIHLLKNKKIDFVIQVGADKENPIVNDVYINSAELEVKNCAGSRYSPSSPLSLIRGLINSPSSKKYAIVGKPCDIAAIRTLKTLSPSFDSMFPYLISFFCAGIPSINATEDILSRFEISSKDLIEFKYRGDGWPGLTKAVTKSGEVKDMTYNDSWGNILNKKLQPRCKICADGIGEAADIVCGDAWYENDASGYPSFEERAGRSLVIVRTAVGDEIIKSCEIAKDLVTESYDKHNLSKIQPFQKERKELSFSRHLALYFAGRSATKFYGYQLFKLSLKGGFYKNIRSFLGALKRSLGKKI